MLTTALFLKLNQMNHPVFQSYNRLRHVTKHFCHYGFKSHLSDLKIFRLVLRSICYLHLVTVQAPVLKFFFKQWSTNISGVVELSWELCGIC